MLKVRSRSTCRVIKGALKLKIGNVLNKDMQNIHTPPGKLFFFSDIMFDLAELFPAAISVQNHKKID